MLALVTLLQAYCHVSDRDAVELHRPVQGATTVSPALVRWGVYFSIASWNLTGDDGFAYVHQLRGHLERPLLRDL